MKKLLRLSLLVIGLVSFAGCALKSTYHLREAHNEPKVDETEVCYLAVWGTFRIIKIDGVKLEGTEKWDYYNPRHPDGKPFHGQRIIAFLPGSHTIVTRRIDYQTWGVGHPKTMHFVGKAGHIYHIEQKSNWAGHLLEPRVADWTNTKEGEKYILAPLSEMKKQSKQTIIYKD